MWKSYRRSGCGGRAERARLFDSKCQEKCFQIWVSEWKIFNINILPKLKNSYRWRAASTSSSLSATTFLLWFFVFLQNKKERYGRWFWKIANWFWEGDWGMSSRHKYRKCCGVFWFGKLRRPNLKTNGGGCNWGPWIEKFLPMEGGVDFLVVECDNRGILMMRGISRNLAGESNPRLPLKPMLFFVSLSWRIKSSSRILTTQQKLRHYPNAGIHSSCRRETKTKTTKKKHEFKIIKLFIKTKSNSKSKNNDCAPLPEERCPLFFRTHSRRSSHAAPLNH